MAHELTIREDNTAEMAYVGATPWHGLGQRLNPNATIEEWRMAAGLNWTIERAPISFSNGVMVDAWPEQEVLFRSDTKTPLSVVTNRYNIVQPGEVLDFFRGLVESAGFQIETAGTLKGGRRIWALARTGLDGEVVANDLVKTYVLLVTSCDGGLATTAQYTSVRVVCNNTLGMSLHGAGNSTGRVKVRHNTVFDPRTVKDGLGLNASVVYVDFMGRMRTLANTSITESMAREYVEKMFELKGTTGGIKGIQESKGFRTVMNLFTGDGRGSRMDGVQGTAWGLLNAVTEYTDFHVRARDQDSRLNNAWFGSGASAKEDMLALLEH